MNASNPIATFTHPGPDPDGNARRARAKEIRRKASELSRREVATAANGECLAFSGTWPTNFSKGLPHDGNGIVEAGAMQLFVNAINTPDAAFDVPLGPADAGGAHRPQAGYTEAATSVGTFLNPINPADKPQVRSWESPVSGHVFDLEGPDAGSVGMAPAPKLGSDELAAEMAEVYAMAVLRDVAFEDMRRGAADDVIGALNAMPWFDATQTPTDAGGEPVDVFSANRRDARFVGGGNQLSRQTLFRGSTPGAGVGPYLSQFLLQGTRDLSGTVGPEDGLIVYGAQRVDQRIESHKIGVDYMTDWSEWLDVQNGANLKGSDQWESGRRFIATPRDLASYVHFDALYQAYLNACLILLAHGAPQDSGLPEPARSPTRDAFATFGGPHILTLVTEGATRALKAVRRQKFNHHLRARPEQMGAVATLSRIGRGSCLGVAESAAADHLAKLQGASANGFSILDAIAAKNGTGGVSGGAYDLPDISGGNYLLPMAFPEGSPMHPAYGAGHATVAGACTTMIKAFFEMYSNVETRERKTLAEVGIGQVLVPSADAQNLVPATDVTALGLTVEGEIDKLAANISIGRNMAGVHYYSDYYDSARMGERIAVGILMEQLLTYPEPVSMTLTSFDGDALTIRNGGPCVAGILEVNGDGSEGAQNEWFERHVAPAPVMVNA